MNGELTLDLTPNDTRLRSDPVARLALTLAKELWMLKDRQLVLENALGRRGIAVQELVEREPPDAAFDAALAAERRRFVGEVVAALQPAGDRA
jgi:hypothetical protein